MCRIGHQPPVRALDLSRSQQTSQIGETNQIAQVINNISIGGDNGGIPGLSFGPRMDGDCFCGEGFRMGPEGRPGPWAEHCCDNELADFGNSAMGRGIGKAAKYQGIASIIAAALGGGGSFLQGLFGGQGIWGYQNA